jgi:hypothetical protein
MPNLVRGEVPFSAAGRELFLAYGTREIAEAQAALGFRRPDPFQPDVAEEIDSPVEDKPGEPKLDASGLPVFRRLRVLVDAGERQRRMLAAFEAVLMNPDPEGLLTFIRIGLRPWERHNGAKLSDEGFHGIVQALGLVRLKMLHFQAVSFGSYLKGEETDEGKAVGAASASST